MVYTNRPPGFGNLVKGYRHFVAVLQVFWSRFTYRIEDDARVEDVVGVKQLLQLPHELIGGSAPLHLHIRCHIAPSTVLTLHNIHSVHFSCWGPHLCGAITVLSHSVSDGRMC